jgi:hypothetical protein
MDEKLICYCLVGFLWATFATRMQLKLHPFAKRGRNMLCTILNYLFWPFAMMIAIVKCPIEVDKGSSSSASSESSEDSENSENKE